MTPDELRLAVSELVRRDRLNSLYWAEAMQSRLEAVWDRHAVWLQHPDGSTERVTIKHQTTAETDAHFLRSLRIVPMDES